MGRLFIIGTPIGNLEDISSRALSTLREVGLLLCEDTRVTRKLLSRYDIHVSVESYREQVHGAKLGQILGRLEAGQDIGLVSDAGTPCISDPGSRLVADILKQSPETEVIPIPGPSAVTTALSVSGFQADTFLFAGFPPHKKGRRGFFERVVDSPVTAVIYESPHRIGKALDSLEEMASDRMLCVGREMTKIHETFYRGTPRAVKEQLEQTSGKGEFVIVIAGKKS